MKTLKCDLCEATPEGETFEEWMKALMPHYMDEHGFRHTRKRARHYYLCNKCIAYL